MDYFRNTDENEGLRDIRADQIAVVGDRLLTDMCLANEMGSWGVWVKDGVVPLGQKSVVSCRSLPVLRVVLSPFYISVSREEDKTRG